MYGLRGNKKILIGGFGIVLAIVIMAFIILDFRNNWINIEPFLLTMRLEWFLLAIIAYALVFILTAYNWAYLTWMMEPSVTIGEYMDIHIKSALVRYIPGGFWNIVGKAYLCNKIGVSKSVSTSAIILEYVFQIASSSLFLVFIIAIPIYHGTGLEGILGLMLAFFLFLLLLPTVARLGTQMISRMLKANEDEIIELNTKSVYLTMARFTFVWLITGVSFIILVLAFTEVERLQGVFLIISYPVSWCAGFLSPSPNGIGIREAALGFLLSSRFSYEFLLLITLTSRIWTVLGEVVAFGLFEIYYYRLKRTAGHSQ